MKLTPFPFTVWATMQLGRLASKGTVPRLCSIWAISWPSISRTAPPRPPPRVPRPPNPAPHPEKNPPPPLPEKTPLPPPPHTTPCTHAPCSTRTDPAPPPPAASGLSAKSVHRAPPANPPSNTPTPDASSSPDGSFAPSARGASLQAARSPGTPSSFLPSPPSLLEHHVSDVGVPLQSLNFQAVDVQPLQERRGLSGPNRVVQFIERQHRSLWHSRKKMFESCLRRLVQIHVEKKRAHQQVRILFDKIRYGVRRVAPGELDLRNMSQEAVLVVHPDKFLQLVVARFLKISRRRVPGCAPILLRYGRKPVERIESINSPRQVLRLQDGAQFCPAHQAEPSEHAAFHDRSFDSQHHLEDLVHCQESLQVLPPHVLRKILQLRFNVAGTVHKNVFERFPHFTFRRGFE